MRGEKKVMMKIGDRLLFMPDIRDNEWGRLKMLFHGHD